MKIYILDQRFNSRLTRFVPKLSCIMLFILFIRCGPTSQSSHSEQAIGKVRISYGKSELHKSISEVKGWPELVQPMNIIVEKGDVIDLVEIIPTGLESPFYYKLKTMRGDVGYAQTWLEPIESYSDRGAYLFVYLQTPYEYECQVEEVDKMIMKYNKFINEYPKSIYVPNALESIAGLHRYTLQCRQPESMKQQRIEKINKIYSILLTVIFNKENATRASDILNKFELKAPSAGQSLDRYDEYQFYTFKNYTSTIIDSLMANIFPDPFDPKE